MCKRLYLYYEQIRYADSNSLRFAQENWDFFCKMRDYFNEMGIELKDKHILDVGCGKSYWLTLLLHSYGAIASGTDTEYVLPGKKISKYLKLVKHNGIERAAKTFYWDIMYGREYYRFLQNEATFPLNFDKLDIRQLMPPHYPYGDNEFDLLVSHEVFEHIADLPGALQEIKRILKPGAYTYIYVHLFPSISGGHHIAWKYPDENPSNRVPPWDHLRENRYPQIPSWINKMREHEYRECFEQAGFKIVDWITYATEGKSLLTPEIKAELSEYSEEELLKKGIVIVAQNP